MKPLALVLSRPMVDGETATAEADNHLHHSGSSSKKLNTFTRVFDKCGTCQSSQTGDILNDRWPTTVGQKQTSRPPQMDFPEPKAWPE